MQAIWERIEVLSHPSQALWHTSLFIRTASRSSPQMTFLSWDFWQFGSVNAENRQRLRLCDFGALRAIFNCGPSGGAVPGHLQRGAPWKRLMQLWLLRFMLDSMCHLFRPMYALLLVLVWFVYGAFGVLMSWLRPLSAGTTTLGVETLC